MAEAGAKALRYIASQKAGTQPCVEAGAVPVLVAALRAHANVPVVAECACRALCNIAGIPAGQTACVSDGAVPAIVAALKNRASVPKVVQFACMALSIITQHSAGQNGEDVCVSEGAVPAIVAALRNHASEPDVAQWASYALFNMGSNNPSHCAAIVAADAAPALAAAFRVNTGAPRIMAHEALDKLEFTDEGESKEVLGFPVSSMTPARVVELMRAGAGDPRVSEEGAKALRRITDAGSGGRCRHVWTQVQCPSL